MGYKRCLSRFYGVWSNILFTEIFSLKRLFETITIKIQTWLQIVLLARLASFGQHNYKKLYVARFI